MEGVQTPSPEKPGAGTDGVHEISDAGSAAESDPRGGRIDYFASTFISYLIDKERRLMVEQAKAIGLLVPRLKGGAAEQKMIRIEDDGDPRSLHRPHNGVINQAAVNVRTLKACLSLRHSNAREAREMYFRNFSVKVIQGPHRERSFALDSIYQVLAVHFENTELNKTHVLLEDDNHSLQWVPSNEVKVNTIE